MTLGAFLGSLAAGMYELNVTKIWSADKEKVPWRPNSAVVHVFGLLAFCAAPLMPSWWAPPIWLASTSADCSSVSPTAFSWLSLSFIFRCAISEVVKNLGLIHFTRNVPRLGTAVLRWPVSRSGRLLGRSSVRSWTILHLRSSAGPHTWSRSLWSTLSPLFSASECSSSPSLHAGL